MAQFFFACRRCPVAAEKCCDETYEISYRPPSVKTGWLLGMRAAQAVLTALGEVLWGYYQSYLCLTFNSKSLPLQAWSGPEGSMKLRFTDYMTTAQDGGRLSTLRTGRLYPPENTPGTHFC